MKRMFWVCMLVFGLMLSWSMVYAADFYVIPVQKCCTCKGTLNGTRWCDNGDGTVTDLTTCLVWLKDGQKGSHWAFWRKSETGTNAHDRAAEFEDGMGGLSDGSKKGDWRLATKSELYGLALPPEGVSLWTNNMRAFTNVHEGWYWSSTAYDVGSDEAWAVDFEGGVCDRRPKIDSSHFVWPVRGGQ